MIQTVFLGSHPTAIALEVLRQWTQIDPLLVIVPTEEDALRLHSDLNALCLLPEFKSDEKTRILIFPDFESSPYSPIEPSLRIRLERAAVLGEIAIKNRGPLCIIATALAASMRLPNKSNFITRCINLATQPAELNLLSGRLLDSLGYQKVELVEDPGSYAIRGHILDVFLVTETFPIRIDFFDTEIESVRSFDPSTQRSGPSLSLQSLTITPTRETYWNTESVLELKKSLKSWCDLVGIQKKLRDTVFELLDRDLKPTHSEFWTPFLDSTSNATLLDWFEENSVLIISLEHCVTLRTETLNNHLEQFKQLVEQPKKGYAIVPSPDILFKSVSKFEEFASHPSVTLFDHLLNPKRPANRTLPSTQIQPFNHNTFKTDLRNWAEGGYTIFLFTTAESQTDRISFLLDLNTDAHQSNKLKSAIRFIQSPLSTGLLIESPEKVAYLPEHLLLSSQQKTKKLTKKSSQAESIKYVSQISVNDLVVHKKHGIGKYLGTVTLETGRDQSGEPTFIDFIQLEYAQKDKLYVPVYHLNLLQKYFGTETQVSLDRLGSEGFEQKKQTIKNEVKKLAVNLLELYAKRTQLNGVCFSKVDPIYLEFEANFPYEETEDQSKAINAVLEDLSSGRIMDRIVCGDVGYGKTEVAIRAAFKAALEGKQVAVLVPTTLLAYQHELAFNARISGFPITVASLSRFKNAKEQKTTIAALKEGKVDIIIGTHRLLSKDIVFKNLALLIVDEEHRFGVEHKEMIKALKLNAHVLTLTATPIPRTLHMALCGLREMSVITTPPVNRLPIRTYVSRWEESIIEEAIKREVERGGQVFFLHNRVQSLAKTADFIKKLFPNIRVELAHGQMSETQLEKTMLEFYEGQIQVLVCTSIIESGLDVPNANTLIVDRADTFGLSQLYQIRGRVGRGQKRGLAYLLLPEHGSVSEDARKRLEIIQKFVDLGSGFSIASHDLELRGGGELLGPQQSGHISAVGFEMYTELLEAAVKEVRSASTNQTNLQSKINDFDSENNVEPEIKAPFSALIPESYVTDLHNRMLLYRKLSNTEKEDELLSLEQELEERFGKLPNETRNLIWVIRIKQLLKKNGISQLTVGNGKVTLLTTTLTPFEPTKAFAMIAAKLLQMIPPNKLVAELPTKSLTEIYFGLGALFGKLTSNF